MVHVRLCNNINVVACLREYSGSVIIFYGYLLCLHHQFVSLVTRKKKSLNMGGFRGARLIS